MLSPINEIIAFHVFLSICPVYALYALYILFCLSVIIKIDLCSVVYKYSILLYRNSCVSDFLAISLIILMLLHLITVPLPFPISRTLEFFRELPSIGSGIFQGFTLLRVCKWVFTSGDYWGDFDYCDSIAIVGRTIAILLQ